MSDFRCEVKLWPQPSQVVQVELRGARAGLVQEGAWDVEEFLPMEEVEEWLSGQGPTGDTVELFLRALKAGLFGSTAMLPGGADGQMLSIDLEEQPPTRRWRLSLRDVRPESFLVLRNLLRAMGPARAGVRTLEQGLRPPAVTQQSMPGYPPRVSQPGFEVDESPDLLDMGYDTVQLVFREPMSPRTEQAATEAMTLWAYVVMMGGYAADDVSQEGLLPADCSAPAFVDAHTLEVSLQVCNSELEALDAFVNLAHRLNATVAAVERVRVE